MQKARGHIKTESISSHKPSRKHVVDEIKKCRSLTTYHKKQLVRAINKGLADKIFDDWKAFSAHKISSEALIENVNKELIEQEFKDDKLYFSSMDDFFEKF